MSSWWSRIGIGVAAFAAIEVLCALIDTRVDHLRLVLVVALVVAVLSLLADAAPVDASGWPRPHPDRSRAAGQDARTSSYLRLLEGHRTAREPDGALRDRIGELADQVLWVRHELTRDDPRAAGLLGPELCHLLDEPARRLSVAEIDRHVRRIEAL